MDALRVIRDHGWEPVLFPLQNLIDHGFPARSGQRWLSTRYHPHLLAAARGCSGTFIPVKPGYYDVKHAAVLRMGSRWTQTTIGDSLIPKPDLVSLIRRCGSHTVTRFAPKSPRSTASHIRS